LLIPEKMTLPTIHTNGTSARELARGYSNARLAVQEAIEILSKVEFNARDYYPQGQDAWNAAVRERSDTFDKLRSVTGELYALEEHCCKSIK
jgi:hypothetical protein